MTKTTVREVRDVLDKVLIRGEDQNIYILVAGTRYPVQIVRALNEVYLIPRRDAPVSRNPLLIVNGDQPQDVA